MVVDLDAAARHADASTSRGADEVPSNLNQSGSDVNAATTMSTDSGGAPIGAFPVDVRGSIQTLAPYGDSDEDVALPEDDIAFCHIASAGRDDWLPCSFITCCIADFFVIVRLFFIMGIRNFSPSWYLMMCMTHSPVSSLLTAVSRKRGYLVDQLSFDVGHTAFIKALEQCIMQPRRNELVTPLLLRIASTWSGCRVNDVDNPRQHVPHVQSPTVSKDGGDIKQLTCLNCMLDGRTDELILNL